MISTPGMFNFFVFWSRLELPQVVVSDASRWFGTSYTLLNNNFFFFAAQDNK
jgi:hypothetical protein